MKMNTFESKSARDMNRRDFLERMSKGATGAALLAGAGAAVGAGTATPLPPAGEIGLAVGWSTTSITPDAPVQLAGQFHERVSTHVLDPCMATALALERIRDDGKEQAILVSCDVVNIGNQWVDAIRKRLEEKLPDFESKKLILNATHTHTGPTLEEGSYKEPDPGVMGPRAYGEFFCERVAEAAVQAWTNRAPGGVSRAVGHAAVGFCRVMVYADGTARMYGKTNDPDWRRPEGASDPGLEILFTWNDQSALTGIVVNIACPSQVVEGQTYVSADFWGPVREELRRHFSEELYVFAMTGAAGDQSPRDLIRRGRNEPDMHSEPGMREMARRIVAGVVQAHEVSHSDVLWDPVFQHRVADIALPARKVTD